MTRLLIVSAMCVSASLASAQSAPVRSPAQKARVAVATATARPGAKDSAAAADSAKASTTRAGSVRSDVDTTFALSREVFSYEGVGRRDPFYSLMLTSELRPTINDLTVSMIAYGTGGEGSVAILIDRVTKDEYRAKVGDRLGRLKVAAITVKTIVFDIDEFGFQRRETLQLTEPTKVRR